MAATSHYGLVFNPDLFCNCVVVNYVSYSVVMNNLCFIDFLDGYIARAITRLGRIIIITVIWTIMRFTPSDFLCVRPTCHICASIVLCFFCANTYFYFFIPSGCINYSFIPCFGDYSCFPMALRLGYIWTNIRFCSICGLSGCCTTITVTIAVSVTGRVLVFFLAIVVFFLIAKPAHLRFFIGQ